MKKKYGIVFAAFALVCLMLAACIVDIPLAVERGGWGPEDEPYNSDGEVSGFAVRGGYGGRNVTVFIVLEEGHITSFRFTGGYSPEFINEINSRSPGWERTILRTNTFDFPVVGSGATGTLRGIRTAGRNALVDHFYSITDDDFTMND